MAAVALTSAVAAAAWMHLSKATILKVAVGPPGFADAELMAAFGRALAGNKANVRIAVEPALGPHEALGKLINGEAELAVMRSDAPPSERIRALAILHTDPVVIVTPDKTKIDDFGDLKGKTIGLLGPPGANDTLLATLRRHYAVKGETKTLAVTPAAVMTSVRERAVDALLFVVPTTRSSRVGETWLAVTNASRRKLTFVPIEDAAAIAAMAPAYEAGEIAAGQFGGSPMLPEESVTTLQVATYLVADRNVPNDAITQLIRSLLEYRQKLSADAPIATLIKAASTEKDALFPVHPGAKVYYAGEETSLMERYGDWLFYGPMLFGALGSAGITLARFLRHDAPERPLLPRLITILPAIREARTLSDVDRLRTDIDAAVRTLAAQAPEEERTAVTALTLNYINQVLAERQSVLLGGPDRKGETIRLQEPESDSVPTRLRTP